MLLSAWMVSLKIWPGLLFLVEPTDRDALVAMREVN